MTIKPLPKTDIRIAKPLYSLRQAAWYLDVPVATLHHWSSRTKTRAPLVTVLRHKSGRWQTVPFIGFAEAFVVKTALDAGVRPSRIVHAVKNMRERAGGIEHALATDRIRTDGVRLFLELEEHEHGGDPDGIEIPGPDQLAFRRLVEPLKRIGFAGDHFANRIELPRFEGVTVIADPYVAAGQPLLMSGGGVRVKDIVDRVNAGDKHRDVARDFGVTLSEVEKVSGYARAS